jgi:transcriptional regulator with GAF, ATPase, and Fis domain
VPRDVTLPENILADPVVGQAGCELLWQAAHADDPHEYLAVVLPRVLSAVGGDFAAVAVALAGRWTPIAQSGRARSLPGDLLAEVLDREAAGTQAGWVAVPLSARAMIAEALVIHCGAETDLNRAQTTTQQLSPILHDALEKVRGCYQTQRRIGRLETLLEIAGRWNQTHEVEPLLVQMAEAATRLLGSDRASIFLWDRETHTLVGRPALGVEGGELRIPDDRGVVGQVVRTGRPRRVDAANDPEQIDRKVDAKTGYKTRSLLCVPLRGSSGELFGAFELINKLSGSFTLEDEEALTELAAHAAIALANAQDRQQLLSTNRRMADQAAEGIQLIGRSPAIEAINSIIRRVADTDLAVLLLGENGTGKEVVARSIHYLSRRRERPFVAVNCAAIPDTLAESELFGHEKGAFTDAKDRRSGKFELAAEGTLFLDEIGDLSAGCQAKLLRVLEEKVLVRVGGSTPIHSNARVIAATNQNLAEMVGVKKFREDLYFRLNVVTIELPPLRKRTGDVILLAEHFLNDFCQKARRPTLKLSVAARERLEGHAWPGNVRELRNLMERLAYLSGGDVIEAEDVAFILSPHSRQSLMPDLNLPLAEATAQYQVQFIQRAIEQANGNVSQAATHLGLHRSNLYRKMRQLGMNVPS